MNSTLLSALLISSLAIGCGGSAAMNRAKTAAVKDPAKTEASVASMTAEDDQGPPFSAPPAPSEAAEKTAAAAPAPAKLADPAATRMPGDFVVHRFSGSFSETPITLTQRVNARSGNTLVIDITFEEGDVKQVLRVRMDDSPEKRGEVLSVARVEGNKEKRVSIDAYEKLMARTAVSADENEEVLGREEVSVDVGGAAMPANKTTYRVRIGKHEGTLRTLQSDRFAWGDLGGEITTENGKVVYKAELVEAGHGDAPKPAVAQTDDAYDDE